MKLERIPETSNYGLVLPPSPEDLEYLSLFRRPDRKPDSVDRHHLYWPSKLYKNNDLAWRFRTHRFNSIWMLRSDHELIHQDYDGVPVPPEDVMLTFLDEAKILDHLGVCVRGVEMIDDAIYEGRARKPKINEDRHKTIETISERVRQLSNFEVMPFKVVSLEVQQLGELPVTA